MKLAPGTRVGPYEVQGSLGAGGMGEVYKAVDTELRRFVALKVLPDQFVSNSERVARFEREATMLASINHPHVAQIYGVVRGDDERLALVMEFVEGDDLAARILRGRLPLDETLAIARQITAALEAAHEIGIVHRDLKPANIKVRSDGVVKVLDFGLARTSETAERSSAGSDSPTITSAAMTERGIILGTASYMSPEQAKGLSVDRRSDIWGFGCVLFEMLSGRRAFRGTTTAETVASVLSDTPDWTLLPVETPEPIRKLLRRCLVRERSQRLDSAAVARIEIDDAVSGATPDGGAKVESGRRRIAWPLGLTAVAIGAIAALVWPGRSSSRPGELRLDIATPLAADAYSFALSPDGQRITFVAGGSSGPLQLWSRALDSAIAIPLPNTEGAVYPFWSPDAKSIGFFANGKLKRVDLSGGAAVTLTRLLPADGTAEFRGPSEVMYVREGSLSVQAFDEANSVLTGAALPVASPVPSTQGRSAFSTSRSGPVAYRAGRIAGAQLRWFRRNGESQEAFAGPDAEDPTGPLLSPSGQRVAIVRHAGGNTDVWIVDRAGGALTRLTVNPAQEVFPVWTPDESAVAFRSSRGNTLDIYLTRIDAGGSDKLLLARRRSIWLRSHPAIFRGMVVGYSSIARR